jgi:phytoene dehydrogenase-like protein
VPLSWVASPSRPADPDKLTAAQLSKAYRRVAPPGTRITMPGDLRTLLRAHEAVSAASLDDFLDRLARGLRVTLSALAHDPASEDLLAPELLLALQALDEDPDHLRDQWPSDPRGLDTRADAFGRPFTR